MGKQTMTWTIQRYKYIERQIWMFWLQSNIELVTGLKLPAQPDVQMWNWNLSTQLKVHLLNIHVRCVSTLTHPRGWIVTTPTHAVFNMLMRPMNKFTISEMADLEVPVQADHGHRNEAPAPEEEARPAVETTALPSKQPAMGKTRYNKKGLSCH